MPETARPSDFVTPAYPWIPDQGDGTYRNPVICADYSDPDAILVGEDFWLTASSFNCTPGLPILHSKDLVNWTIVNHALANVPGDQYKVPLHGCGVWAPAIRFHAGKYWIFFPTPDEGIYVTTAADPRGQWSDPHLLLPGKGLIDPCPLWDDDGKAYLVHAYAKSRAGIKNLLRVRPMSPDATQILGDGQVVYNDPEHQPTLEGPKFHKRDGYYYISAPAGGVPTGWQLILRSKQVYGPYEPKIVLAQGSTPVNGPHQGAMVDGPDGRWWFVHFQERLPFGRIVHLQPVRWENAWPVIGVNQNKDGVGEPVAHHDKPAAGALIRVPQTSDDFTSATLGLQWQWHANHEPGWYTQDMQRKCLRLTARPGDADFSKVPNLLLQKLPAVRFRAETRLELFPTTDQDRAGLIVMGLQHAALYLRRDGHDFAITYVINNKEQLLTHTATPTINFRVDMAEDGTCHVAYREPHGDWQAAPAPFKATEGRWIGAKVGIFALSTPAGDGRGAAEFAHFQFSPLP